MAEIRVFNANQDLVWEEVPRPDGDETAPGEAVEVFASADGQFTAGLWRRPVREGEMTRPFDEISIIIDGVVEVIDPDGTVHRAEPGDVLVTPRGSVGTWRCVTGVTKFWAICETDAEAPGTRVLPRETAFDWQDVPRPPEDTAPPGEEALTFRSADGSFATGMWRRDPEEGNMALDDYDEIAYILEGDVEITETDGTVHRVGPGDILVTPKGSKAVWRSRSPVRKFWAIYRGPTGPDERHRGQGVGSQRAGCSRAPDGGPPRRRLGGGPSGSGRSGRDPARASSRCGGARSVFLPRVWEVVRPRLGLPAGSPAPSLDERDHDVGRGRHAGG